MAGLGNVTVNFNEDQLKRFEAAAARFPDDVLEKDSAPTTTSDVLRGGQLWVQEDFPFHRCFLVSLGIDSWCRILPPMDSPDSYTLDTSALSTAEMRDLLKANRYTLKGQYYDEVFGSDNSSPDKQSPASVTIVVPIRVGELLAVPSYDTVVLHPSYRQKVALERIIRDRNPWGVNPCAAPPDSDAYPSAILALLDQIADYSQGMP